MKLQDLEFLLSVLSCWCGVRFTSESILRHQCSSKSVAR